MNPTMIDVDSTFDIEIKALESQIRLRKYSWANNVFYVGGRSEDSMV